MVRALEEFLTELETDDPGDHEDVFPARLKDAQTAAHRLHQAFANQLRNPIAMGCIYRHKGRPTWWVKYRGAGGKWQYESSHSAREKDATHLLRLREGDTAKGIPVTSHVGRLRFEEAREDLVTYHKANGRDTKKLEGRIAMHLTPFFERRKMTEINGALVNAYVASRLEQKAAPTRPSTASSRGSSRCSRSPSGGKLMARPTSRLLEENNARQGFFERSSTKRS